MHADGHEVRTDAREMHTRPGAPAAGRASATHVVPAACAGLRLDQALAKMLPEHSRSRLRAWIDAGDVIVDGRPFDAKRRVHGGEHVDIAHSAATAPLADEPEDIALRVVHEDDAIIVVDKPAGLVVHPGSGNPRGTLLNALLHRDPALSALPRAGIVHRLDKDTSGLMVVARTPQAHTDLVRQLAARTVQREYVAVAGGDVARATIVDAPIGRHPVQRTAMAVVAKGRPARTHVDVVERFGAATLLRCRLETGRTHQIRVHLAAIGHPLLGDPAYGGRNRASAFPFARQALHAERLGLVHPATREAMAWQSPLPADLAALIDALRARRTDEVR
jgi:23S rRNA pseudouridine1911/1915/1917 synthase